jgi:hypothetical protein
MSTCLATPVWKGRTTTQRKREQEIESEKEGTAC